jgi:hypothetical protein
VRYTGVGIEEQREEEEDEGAQDEAREELAGEAS